MTKYTLTNEDYELIRNLLEVTTDLKRFYDSLMMLEINGQKETSDYIKIKNELNRKLEEERILYAKFGNDTSRLQAIMEYFIEKNKINSFSEDLKVLVEGQEDEITKRRIIIKLLTKKLELDKDKLYQMGLDLDKDLEESGVEVKAVKNYAYYGLSNLLVLSGILKQDFLRTLLILIKKQMVNSNNQEFYHMTYMLSFLYEFLEQEFLSNYSDDRLFWSSKLVAELKSISEDAYLEAKEVYGVDVANMVCECSNNDLWHLILRVSLLFCSIDDIANIRKKYPENINAILEDMSKDKELPLIMSLKPRG